MIISGIFDSTGGLVILMVALLGFMMLTTILPQRKRQKQQQAMKASIGVGTRIKTIGGFIGVVSEVNEAESTYLLDIGVPGSPVFVTIDKNAIYSNLDTVVAPKGAAEKKEKPAAEAPKDIFGDKDEETKRSIDE